MTKMSEQNLWSVIRFLLQYADKYQFLTCDVAAQGGMVVKGTHGQVIKLSKNTETSHTLAATKFGDCSEDINLHMNWESSSITISLYCKHN
jgi:hypothetical protein